MSWSHGRLRVDVLGRHQPDDVRASRAPSLRRATNKRTRQATNTASSSLPHAVGLTIFGLARGWNPIYPFGEGLLLAALGGLAAAPQLSRKMRSAVAALACVMSSAVLVQFWGGVIEAHFHFFVVVALISLYQDWLPFSLAVGFVALDHGVLGTLQPSWVYNHPAALANPWGWAAIHAVLVLAECVALIVVWRANEEARADTDRVLRSTGEGLLGVDADCQVTFANPAALRLTGRDERDLLGKPLYGLLRGDDDRPAFAPDILRTNPGAFTSEAWLAQAGGAKVPVEVLCTPIVGRSHQEGAVVAVRDLTDRLRAESARVRASSQQQELDRLKEVDSFKTRFMNMAAHELSTPMTPIKLQMHLLKSHSDEPALETHRRSIHLLDRNFQRLQSLVGDLLDSSRLQSDRMPLRPEPLDMAALVNEVTESFEPAASAARVRLVANAPPAIACIADGDRITQAITNLLSNALKFTPPDGSVQVEVSAKDRRVRITVKDTGSGLTAKQAARLFQPFEQVHDAQIANKTGSGLGLYIARGIVELHGGRIWVESAGPGKGSTFAFEIPQEPTIRSRTDKEVEADAEEDVAPVQDKGLGGLSGAGQWPTVS